MPSTLNQLDICNLALSRVGARAISSLTDLTNTSAIACNTSYMSVLTEVSRSHPWSCLLCSTVLTATPQTPINPSVTVTSTNWAPLTAYSVNAYVMFSGYLYQCLIANTSTANFVNDLTQGFWFQTDTFNADPFCGCGAGQGFASGWASQFPLPSDYLLLVELNDNECRPQVDYEIQGISLYTNDSHAVIKYVALDMDATHYDSMFVDALSLRLGASIATDLRKDGGAMAAGLLALYNRALGEARTQDGNERKWKRYSPVQDSSFVWSRYHSTNG